MRRVGWMMALALICNRGLAQWPMGRLLSGAPPDSAWVDPFKVVANPACLADVKSFQAALSASAYQGVTGLRFMAATAGWRIPGGGVGIAIQHWGAAGLQRNELALMYAKPFGEISCGLVFGASSVSVAGIAPGMVVRTGLGLLSRKGPFTLAVSTEYARPVGSETRPPTTEGLTINAQAHYNVSPVVSFGVTVSRIPGFPAGIGGTIHYQPSKMRFALGFDDGFKSYYMSSGWCLGTFIFNVQIGFQTYLGLAHSLEVDYEKLPGS